jgi:heterodisulfide reductase subunit C
MNGWGFNIQSGRQIDMDKNNRSMAVYLEANEPTFRLCISCGACTATCSSGNFTGFNFRKLTLLIRRGNDKTVPAEIMQCMLCGKCQLVCPRGVNTRHVIDMIKTITAKPMYHEI